MFSRCSITFAVDIDKWASPEGGSYVFPIDVGQEGVHLFLASKFQASVPRAGSGAEVQKRALMWGGAKHCPTSNFAFELWRLTKALQAENLEDKGEGPPCLSFTAIL